jgi:hypothetical protein
MRQKLLKRIGLLFVVLAVLIVPPIYLVHRTMQQEQRDRALRGILYRCLPPGERFAALHGLFKWTGETPIPSQRSLRYFVYCCRRCLCSLLSCLHCLALAAKAREYS